MIVKVQQSHIRKEIKKRIKEGISDEELTLITVTPNNRDLLEWKENHEFFYEGQLYDIVRTEVVNETTIVYHVLPDTKEHLLIAQFYEKIKKDRNQDEQSNLTVKFFNMLFKLPPSPVKQEAIVYEEHPKTVFNYTNLYHSITLDITSPPPKQV